MPSQTAAEKPEYTFVAGLITDQSPVATVSGSALDMENFEIDTTGGLRRRKGITLESGGSTVTVSSTLLVGDEAFNKHIWRNAGGDPARTLIVVQVGVNILFFEESDTISASSPLGPISIETFKTSTSTTTAELRVTPLSFSDGRSTLFVAGPLIQPFYIELSDTSLTATPIDLRVRDFTGVDDGVLVYTTPTTLSGSHKYNLFNRGWTAAEYGAYFTSKSVYPSKRMVPYMGYIRTVNVAHQDGYGVKAWNSDKMAAEVFGGSSAPQGSMTTDPFNTTVGYSTATAVDISTFSVSPGSPATITINTGSVHGLSTGDIVVIAGNSFTYTYAATGPWGIPIIATGTFNGTRTVTVVDTDTFTFTYGNPNFATAPTFVSQYLTRGTVTTVVHSGASAGTYNSSGYTTIQRPTTVGWYAGRVWYAGTACTALADVLLFSPIIEGVDQYGKCYQRNDPTGEHFNVLLPSDGGTIKVPGLHGVLTTSVLRSSLLVFAKSGVWEVRGASAAGFTADNYIVRKLTDAECTSERGVARTDSGLVFVTKRGLYAIGADPNSGQLSSYSLTAQRINTYWSALDTQALDAAQTVYDDAKKRVYVTFSRTTTHVTTPESTAYTEALVLDTRLGKAGAFYKITLPHTTGSDYGRTCGIIAIDSGDNSETSKKIKFAYSFTTSGTSSLVSFCDMDNAQFEDISGEEHIPFFKAAYDNTEDFHKRKSAAHYVFMFLGRQDTGSVFMQGRWNWADSGASGKWSNPQQTYRPRTSDYNEVIVTRNKLRGCGRTLAMYVYGEEGEDAHIHGWLIQYGVT